MTRDFNARGEGGFSLLEIVIAVTVLSVMLGMAVPVASMAFQSKAKRSTRAELDQLAEGVAAYFEDVNDFPAEIDDLLIEPTGVSGWTGPYLAMDSTDPLSGDSDWTVDAWSRDYVVTESGLVLTVASTGADGVSGTEADIAITIDGTPIRRRQTLATLVTINVAVTQYNGIYLPGTPLSTTWDIALNQLVTANLLPAKEGYETDEWGDAFVPVPAGQSPVVQIGSVNVGS